MNSEPETRREMSNGKRTYSARSRLIQEYFQRQIKFGVENGNFSTG
jgi:hypothetical protein